MSLKKIKKALISVSDKTGIIDLAHILAENNIEIISTGGTAELIKKQNIKVTDISDFTGFPEIMHGRIKTLHPKVHGALLCNSDNETHKSQALANNINCIDLLIVNFYPFEEVVQKNSNHESIIENIDIGGPAMVRSASKNYYHKTIVSDIEDYYILIEQLKENDNNTTLEFRKNQAKKAFNLIAQYDQSIATYFAKDDLLSFSDNISLSIKLKNELRYGENSHQKAAVYHENSTKYGITNAIQLNGKQLSYNNYSDADAAFNLIMEFNEPTAAIIKHANPCGAASSDNILTSYLKAFEADSRSAFGGIVAFNTQVEENLAEEISKIFYEVIIAPSYSNAAMDILKKKKNLRILKVILDKNHKKVEIKSISGGFLIQETDNEILNSFDLIQAGEISLSEIEIKQLIFAMSTCKHVKSNAIVIANNFQTVGIGAGQTSRIDSFEIACKKANQFCQEDGKIINKCQNAFLASDAFLPFPDNIEIAQKYGIKAIIAPSGSINDKKVIEAANKHSIALMFIKNRHFKH